MQYTGIMKEPIHPLSDYWLWLEKIDGYTIEDSRKYWYEKAKNQREANVVRVRNGAEDQAE